MMIFAYDYEGVIMTDTVPCERNVTGVYYCAFMQENAQELTSVARGWTTHSP